MNLLNALIFLYACTGIISSLAYLLTIREQLRGKKSATISSYLLWTVTGFVSFLYALIVIQDFLLTTINALSFALCAIILLLALILEREN